MYGYTFCCITLSTGMIWRGKVSYRKSEHLEIVGKKEARIGRWSNHGTLNSGPRAPLVLPFSLFHQPLSRETCHAARLKPGLARDSRTSNEVPFRFSSYLSLAPEDQNCLSALCWLLCWWAWHAGPGGMLSGNNGSPPIST